MSCTVNKTYNNIKKPKKNQNPTDRVNDFMLTRQSKSSEIKCEEEAACKTKSGLSSYVLFQTDKDEGSMRRMVPAALFNPSHCTLAPAGTHRQCPQLICPSQETHSLEMSKHCKRLRHTRQPHLHPHILIRQKTESPLL